MTNYIIKFTFDHKCINERLMPWQQTLNPPKGGEKSSENEIYQIGLAITNNNIMFISPFFIHVPYSNIELLYCNNINIKLKLKTYCFFSRLALFEFDQINSIDKKIYNHIFENALNISSMTCQLSDIKTQYIYI